MSVSVLRAQVQVFGESWRQLSALYDDHARSVGFSTSTLHILYTLHSSPGDCTQKTIRERTLLPKQTINAAVSGFRKRGLVELKKSPQDRRHKVIRLTRRGRAYAAKYVPAITAAEYRAMERLTPAQRSALLELTRQYTDQLRIALQGE